MRILLATHCTCKLKPRRYFNGYSVLTSSVVDRGFELRWDKTKDDEICTCICCFSAKHAALKKKRKDWFARNQDNIPECDDRTIRGLLFL